jgi:putative inorganic carbon (HCO3(-)) transporter
MAVSVDTSPQQQPWWRRVAEWFSRFELLWLALAAPFLLFPNQYTPYAAALIIFTWPVRRLAAGAWTRSSPLNPPAFLILAAALIGALVSADYALSEAKWWGIFLQVAIYFALLNSLRSEQQILRFTSLFLFIACAVALLAFLGTNWDVQRLFFVPAWVYDLFPRLNISLPNSFLDPQTAGFSARQVGHTMGMILPLALTLLIFAQGWPLRLPSALFLLLGGSLLILSSALMGIFGALVGLALVAVWWKRWLIIPLLLGFLALAVLIYLNQPVDLMLRALDPSDEFGIGFVLRFDIWSRALAMIRDMPFTGIGLNTFPLVQSHFYIGHLIGPEVHAHQLWLQTALDLGLPGLLAFIWLLVAFAYTVVRGYQLADSRQLQVLLVGLAAGVLAYVAAGTLDVTTLGSKPVAALWAMFGIAGATLSTLQEEKAIEPLKYGKKAPILLISGFLLITILIPMVISPAAGARNFGLVQAHKAIYEARLTGVIPTATAEEAESMITRALAQNPQQAQLLGIRASLHAWLGNDQQALADLSQRVLLDSNQPLQQYAPFLAWPFLLRGEPVPNSPADLDRIYKPWQNRFPDRAENYVMRALLQEISGAAPDQAAVWLDRGRQADAQPASLLSAASERPGRNNPVTYGED